MQNIDELLQEALSPEEEMSEELKTKIRMRVSEGKEQNMSKVTEFGRRRKNLPAAVAMAIALLAVPTVTAFAAWKYLSAGDVAEKNQDEKLAEAFADEKTWGNGEVQSYGGYDISLLGLVSGKEISDNLITANGEVMDDNTYAVVAISRHDGTPMPDTASDEYGKTDFLVSPYIEGYNPAVYNIFSFEGGGYSAFVENGIEYRIMHTTNIEPFADHTIYLGVTDGTFYNQNAFHYDPATGRITRNDSYEGVNALFTLPISAEKADAQKAEEILARIDNHSDDEEENVDLSDRKAQAFVDMLTPENIDEYAEPVESTRQVLTPDKDGYYSYHYELSNGHGGSGTQSITDAFPDGETGMQKNFSWSASGDGPGSMEGLVIETNTLNEDGTVTFVIYVPKN
ncbi:MAG: hypothetical protein IJ567_07450 [Lachnospiraceae bacterium]|nr:hypothetical protein [Lachnospiraceae bacterium]